VDGSQAFATCHQEHPPRTTDSSYAVALAHYSELSSLNSYIFPRSGLYPHSSVSDSESAPLTSAGSPEGLSKRFADTRPTTSVAESPCQSSAIGDMAAEGAFASTPTYSWKLNPEGHSWMLKPEEQPGLQVMADHVDCGGSIWRPDGRGNFVTFIEGRFTIMDQSGTVSQPYGERTRSSSVDDRAA